MAIIKELNPGDTLKVYEDGVAAEFVVAQHNYEKDLNGKGKTMLMRTTLLKDAVQWGNNKKDVSWKNEPTLRNWLENTYAARLSEDTLKTIVPVTIRYDYGSSESGTLEEQRFFVPRVVDFSGDTALFTGIRRFFEDSLSGGRADITEGSNIYDLWTYVFSTRSSKNYEDGDNTRGEVLSLYVKHGRGADPGSPGYINTYWDTTTGQWGVSSSNILVCFCVDENATVDDNGCLTSNSGPEIQSNYFGMNGVFGRWGKFGLPYRVYDADGDTITVTEKLNGEVHRTFTAIQNGVYRFEISQKELENFDWNADYILTVEASDGRTTNRKSCKVNRIRSSGYVVYIGRIKGTADGQSYYWTERNILDDPFNENAPVILDPEVTLEANEISSFTFTVPVSNPFYDKLELKKPVVSIEEDGREIFMGYITEMEKNFELDMEVTCESEFGYLQDRDCLVENKFYTASELLALALTVEDDPEEHVGFKGEGKVFLPGNVTVEKPESDTDKETKAISDCWSVLTNSLTGKYGGYLRLRKEIKMVDGVRVYTRYLDYLAKLNDKTDQVIELGKNLLDISYYIKAGDIVNSVKAYGWYTSGWFFWETTNPISREAYNGESIKKYGLCQRVLVVEGTDSTGDSLLKKATDELIALQARWKEIGAVSRRHSDAIWKRFRAACDKFFERKASHFASVDGEYEENLRQKLALLDEMAAADVKAGGYDVIREFQRRWGEIGFVPIKQKDAIQKKYKAAVDALFNTLRGSERDRSMNRFREKVSTLKSAGSNRLRSERERLYNKVRQLEQEIGLLENNIGFFAKSKNAEALVADVKAKIDRAREEMAAAIEKVKLIDRQAQEENQEHNENK